MRMKLRGWMKWKPKRNPKWSVLCYILRFFAVFGCFFVYLLMDFLACGGACASSFWCFVGRWTFVVCFFGCFLRDVFTKELSGLLCLKNDLFVIFFDEKSAFTVDLVRKNNGFSLYMVKYGNNYICSGYLCLFFAVFEYLVCKKYEWWFFSSILYAKNSPFVA